MQELQRRQKELQKFHDLIKEGASKTVEERVAYNKDLEYNKHANLFAVSYSTIHKAACDGSVSGIKYFMQLKSKPKIRIDDLDKFGLRPIHYAAERGFNDAIETMLSFKCPVDALTHDGMTALMYAAKDGRIETMRLLVAKKANLRAVNRAGMSVAHFAAQNDFVEVFGELLEMFAAQKEEALKQIEDAELNVENAPMAAAQGKAGGGAAGKSGAKAAASGGGAATTPTKKKKAGDDSDADSGDDESEQSLTPDAKPVAHVLDEDDEDIDDAERLRREFRDFLNMPDTAIIDIASRNGTRPLHIAATFNALRTVNFLASHGADIEAVDSAGETPLHKAARRSNFDVYRALVARGAKEHVRNMSRETPKELLADCTKV